MTRREELESEIFYTSKRVEALRNEVSALRDQRDSLETEYAELNHPAELDNIESKLSEIGI